MSRVVEGEPWSVEVRCLMKHLYVGEADDLAAELNSDGPTPVTLYYLYCPVCGSRTRIENSAVYPNVREAARARAGIG